MHKGDLIRRIATDAGLSQREAEKALNSFLKGITEELGKGNKVTIENFGTFSVSRRSARKGRNPQTGKEINIPAIKAAYFKPSKNLLDPETGHTGPRRNNN